MTIINIFYLKLLDKLERTSQLVWWVALVSGVTFGVYSALCSVSDQCSVEFLNRVSSFFFEKQKDTKLPFLETFCHCATFFRKLLNYRAFGLRGAKTA